MKNVKQQFLFVILPLLQLAPFTVHSENLEVCIQGIVNQAMFKDKTDVSDEEKRKLAQRQCEGISKNLVEFKVKCDDKKVQQGHGCVEMIKSFESILNGNPPTPAPGGPSSIAKANIMKLKLQAIVDAVKYFYIVKGNLPSDLEELANIESCDGPECNFDKKEYTLDIWNNKYEFKADKAKKTFTVTSYGADGKSGGIDQNTDITLDGKIDS